MKIIICLILLNVYLFCNGQQNFTFNHLGPNEGLIAEHIPYMTKDSQGFLWLCSNTGLIRYDGKDFIHFRNSFTDTTSISNDLVNFVLEDTDGFLWVATNQGLNKFNPQTKIFQRFQHNPYNATSIASNEVARIFQDSKGRIWVGTTSGLSLYVGNNTFKNWTNFKSIKRPMKYTAHHIVEDHTNSNILWVSGDAGFYQFNINTEEFIEISLPTKMKEENILKEIPLTSIAGMYKDVDGTLWLGNHYGELFHFNPLSREWRSGSFGTRGKFDQITRIIPYSQDTLWICTGSRINGSTLHLLDKKNFTMVPFPQLSKAKEFPLKEGVNYVFKDDEGIIWFSSNNSICKLDPYLQYFGFFPLTVPKETAAYVASIREVNNLVYAGISGHLYIIDIRDQTVKELQLSPPSNYKRNNLKFEIRSLNTNRNHDKLFIGTSYGLYTYTINSGKIEYNPNLPQKSSSITKVLEDENGGLWISYYFDGLYKVENNKIIELTNKLTSIVNSPTQLKIYDIEEDRNGKIWVATHAGVRVLDKRLNEITDIQTYITHGEKLVSLKVMDLQKDEAGNMWIATLGNGVLGIKIKEGGGILYWAYSVKDGLSDNNINQMAFDHSGNLWAVGFRGLIRINPATSKTYNYFKNDGLITDKMNNFSIHCGVNGNLYLSSIMGFQYFNPTTFISKNIIPRVHVKKTNAPYALNTGTKTNSHLSLSYFQNELSFSFYALNFSKPESNKYKYQLKGYQDYWITATPENNSVSYTNLAPGNYTFTVQAANHDNVWNTEGSSLHITILPPPWKTWWAYTAYGFVALLALLTARDQVIKRERLKAKMKLKEIEAEKYQELNILKSRFFANISHEFRTPLTLILAPLQKKLENTIDTQEKIELALIQRNAQRLLTLVNQLLELSRLEAGTLKINYRHANLLDTVQLIVSRFLSMISSKEINFELKADEPVILFFDPDKVENILTNLLSNAVKFTPTKGTITVTVKTGRANERYSQGFAEIQVQDSGIGIPPENLSKIFDRFYQVDNSSTREHEGTGIGLALAKELTDLHHGTLYATSEVNTGSIFTLQLPLGSAHLTQEEVVQAMNTSEATTAEEPLLYEDVEQEKIASAEIILIIEDNRDLRKYLRNELIKSYQIMEAADGEEGLAVAFEKLPTLIISDVMMPKKDGIKICELLKTDERTSHIPVILLTARADIESKLHGLETGADDYIPKPFVMTELMLRVHNLIHNRKLLRDKYTAQLAFKPAELKVESMDQRFLKNVMEIMEKHMDDTSFSVEKMAKEAGLSQAQLYRKLHALTEYTPNEFIRHMRLQRAADLLKQQAGNVAEVAYQVGFNNLSYFAKVFKEKFGITPSEFGKTS